MRTHSHTACDLTLQVVTERRTNILYSVFGVVLDSVGCCEWAQVVKGLPFPSVKSADLQASLMNRLTIASEYSAVRNVKKVQHLRLSLILFYQILTTSLC
jgi:hypothetical protein